MTERDGSDKCTSATNIFLLPWDTIGCTYIILINPSFLSAVSPDLLLCILLLHEQVLPQKMVLTNLHTPCAGFSQIPLLLSSPAAASARGESFLRRLVASISTPRVFQVTRVRSIVTENLVEKPKRQLEFRNFTGTNTDSGFFFMDTYNHI